MQFKEFIKKVANSIKEKKLTLKQVAEYAGIDVSYLSKILSGQRNPPYEEKVIAKIAKILGLDEDELIFSAGKVPQKYQQYFSDKKFIKSIIELMRTYHKYTFDDTEILLQPQCRDNKTVHKNIAEKNKLQKLFPDELL